MTSGINAAKVTKGREALMGITHYPHIHPNQIITSACSSILPFGSVQETFSALEPKKLNVYADSDEISIDGYLGMYFPTLRKIEIYPNAIEQCANRLDVEPSSLMDVVRLHEHAHAINHLGILPSQFNELAVVPVVEESAHTWEQFFAERTDAFNQMSDEVLEQVAQCITYASIKNYTPPAYKKQEQRFTRMLETFERLESKCPPIYQLSDAFKALAPTIEWEYSIESLIKEPSQSIHELMHKSDLVLK